MEDFWATPSQGAIGSEHGSLQSIGDPADLHADDPLGDEAAFPTTWQHLASDASRD